MIKKITKLLVSRSRGRARFAVRGLRASKPASTRRLKAIAALRAPTIATSIQAHCFACGRPRAARKAPRKANGRANTVCSILIISSVIRNLFNNRAPCAKISYSWAETPCSPNEVVPSLFRSEGRDSAPICIGNLATLSEKILSNLAATTTTKSKDSRWMRDCTVPKWPRLF